MVVRGHVRNGRLVVDEPTDLPDGAEVLLAEVDDGEDDTLTAEEAQGIEEAIASVERGEGIPAAQVFAELRARRSTHRAARPTFHAPTVSIVFSPQAKADLTLSRLPPPAKPEGRQPDRDRS